MEHAFSAVYGGPGTMMRPNMRATFDLSDLLREASESALSPREGVVGWVENARRGMPSVRSRRADAPEMSNAAVGGRSGV